MLIKIRIGPIRIGEMPRFAASCRKDLAALAYFFFDKQGWGFRDPDMGHRMAADLMASLLQASDVLPGHEFHRQEVQAHIAEFTDLLRIRFPHDGRTDKETPLAPYLSRKAAALRLFFRPSSELILI